MSADAPAPPPFVSPAKRMTDADVRKKRRGVFVTALPGASADPVNGVGGTLQANVFANGDPTDPYFAYTPYRLKTSLYGQLTTLGTGRMQVGFDAPFVLDTPWRMKLDLKYKHDPNRTFFGLTPATLDPLPGGAFAAYKQGLADARFDMFGELESMANAKFERPFLDANARAMVGYELQHLSFAIDPASRLARSGAPGQAGGPVSILQSALIYDTRDFEPDPTRGVFLEAADELSGPALGSQFAFNKLLFQAKHFQRLWPDRYERTVLATRLGYGTIMGEQAPFFEYHDQWTTEGSITALGGAQTLRGYKPNRFLGRTVGFANVELRHRFLETEVLGQDLSFAVVPFLDFGAVGDQLLQVRLDRPRAAVGTGLRVGWNRSTIVVFDVAMSEEDAQAFLNFNRSY